MRLLRDRLTLQAWLEGVVRRAVSRGDSPRVELEGYGYLWKLAVRKGAPVKQVVGRIRREELARLKRELRAARVPFTQWLFAEIVDYADAEEFDAVVVLSPRVWNLIRDSLPPPKKRGAIVRMLSNWPEEVIVEAASGWHGLRAGSLRAAVRQGNPEGALDILAVASKAVDLRTRLAQLRTKQQRRVGSTKKLRGRSSS